MIKRENNGGFILNLHFLKHIKKNNFYLKIRSLFNTKNLQRTDFVFFSHEPLLYGIAFGLLLCYSSIKLTFFMTSLINLQELFLLAAYVQNASY